MKRHIFILIGLIALVFPTFAQITIDFPFTRMVFQRDLENRGKILITGSTIPKIDSVTVQFVPIAPETGQLQPEERCTNFRNENKQLFFSIIDAPSGWYNLIIRTYRNNQLIDVNSLEKIGIGDVFLIAGQSNAQGNGFRNPPPSVDPYERVGTILDYSMELTQLSTFNYQRLLAHFNLYPTGSSAWCYGLLGDLLVQRNNVPIMFLNAAMGSTSSTDWALSVENKAQHTANRADFPYHLLAKTLQFYGNITGFRAILWHQGEYDTLFPPIDSYFTNVSKVIQETRKLVNFPLPWVISEASYFLEKTSPAVIADQRRLVHEIHQVYAGPATDGYLNARSDGIHFSNEPGYNGLSLLAHSWEKALSPSFFENAKPLLPTFTLPTVLYKNKTIKLPSTFAIAPYKTIFDSFQFIKSQNGNHYVSPKVVCPEIISITNTGEHPSDKTNKLYAQTKIEIGIPIQRKKFSVFAEEFILLSPGFTTESNSLFEAHLKGCYEGWK